MTQTHTYTYDHRGSIVAYIQHQATKNRGHNKLPIATELDALASNIAAQLDIDPGNRDVATPLQTLIVRIAFDFKVTPADIIGPSRHELFVQARDALVWVAKKKLKLSNETLAGELDRVPQSIMKAYGRAEELRHDSLTFRHLTDSVLMGLLVCEHCQHPLAGE